MGQEKTENGSLFKLILSELKKSLIFIIVFVILVTGIGAVFAFTRKPTYTAKEVCVYKAKMSEYIPTSPYDYTASNMYFASVIDFFTWGEVLERANSVYEEYLNQDDFDNVTDYLKARQTYEKAEVNYSSANHPELDYLDEFIGEELVINTSMHRFVIDKVDSEYFKLIGTYVGMAWEKDSVGGTVVDDYYVKVLKFTNRNGVEFKVRLNEYIEASHFDEYKEPSGAWGRQSFSQIYRTYQDRGYDIEYYGYITDFDCYRNYLPAPSSANYVIAPAIKVESNNASFVINVKYSDDNARDAIDKAKVLIYAIDAETNICRPKKDDNSDGSFAGVYKYFNSAMYFYDYGTPSVTTDFNAPLTVFLVFLAGVIVAFVIVYVKYFLTKLVEQSEKTQTLVFENKEKEIK